jgi:hypothetical protein
MRGDQDEERNHATAFINCAKLRQDGINPMRLFAASV